MAEQKSKINRVSFSLEPDYQKLLAQIAKKMRTTMTMELRRMIDERASSIGLKPIAPVSGDRRGAGDD